MPKREKPSSGQHPLNNGSRAVHLPGGAAHLQHTGGSGPCCRFQPGMEPTLLDPETAVCDPNHRRIQRLIPNTIARKSKRPTCDFAINPCFLELYCTIQPKRTKENTPKVTKLLELQPAHERRHIQILLRRLIDLLEQRGCPLGPILCHGARSRTAQATPKV
jgi:hypothetical protein